MKLESLFGYRRSYKEIAIQIVVTFLVPFIFLYEDPNVLFYATSIAGALLVFELVIRRYLKTKPDNSKELNNDEKHR